MRQLTAEGTEEGSPINDDPAWSPSGRQIAYSRRSPLVNAGEFVKWISAEIWVVDASGDGARQITGVTGGHFLDSSPTWSPDGLSIAFTREDAFDEQKPGIYVVGSDGEGSRRVAARSAFAIDWSPDGLSLAYVAGLWETGTAGKVGTIDLQTHAIETFPVPGAYDVAWAPDGRMLAVAGDRGVSIVTPRGKQVRRIQTSGPAFGVSWSPTGLQLAYGATRNGRGSYIYVVDTDGHGAKRITGRGSSYAPDWRP